VIVAAAKRGGAVAPGDPLPPGPQQPAQHRPLPGLPQRHPEIQLDQEGTDRKHTKLRDFF